MTSSRLRSGLACLLLLGLSVGWILPVAVEPDHYLEHHGSSPPSTSDERVALHAEDGEHHHENARLELGETFLQPPCVLCAQLGKTPVVGRRPAGRAVRLEARIVPPGQNLFRSSALRRGPEQPRAPPRV